MEEIVEIFQYISKFKREEETIIDFYERYNIQYTFISNTNNYILLTYENIEYQIRTENDIVKFLNIVFRKLKLLRILKDE